MMSVVEAGTTRRSPGKLDRGVVADAPAILPRDRRASNVAALSKRETEVLTLLAEGFRLNEIAAALHLSMKSFYTARRSLFAKLGARSDSHAAAIGFRRGLLAVDRRARELQPSQSAG
jgi:DNA-binding CsgD family transcriptional regulator